jgi:hypothetical protein
VTEIAFVGIGPGAGRWLKEAGPAGAVRIRARMARAIELATVLGNGKVDQALGLAAMAGRFADDDLVSILEHIAANQSAGESAGEVVRADVAHSAQSGTIAWQALGQPPQPEELDRLMRRCACPVCARPPPTCWQPPARNAGIPPRSCGC